MTSSKWLAALAGLCCSIASLQGQTSDWSSVEKLVRGTSISVVKRGRQGCELVKVTATELICDRAIAEAHRTLVFARGQVREVRLERPENNRIITGAIVGAAVGGLIGFLGGGQSSDPEARGYARAFGIPIGALVGGTIGRTLHRHGVVIYRRT